MKTSPRSLRILPVLLAAAWAPATLAQAPAQGAVPKHACTKPGEFPGKLASDRARRAWQNEMKAFGDCVKKFADDQRAISEQAIKAANAAVEEYNALLKAAQDEMQQ